MPLVKLTSRYFDGELMHPVGAEVMIENPPQNSILVDTGRRVRHNRPRPSRQAEYQMHGELSAAMQLIASLSARLEALEEPRLNLDEGKKADAADTEETKEPETLSELQKKEEPEVDPAKVDSPTAPSALVKKGK